MKRNIESWATWLTFRRRYRRYFQKHFYRMQLYHHNHYHNDKINIIIIIIIILIKQLPLSFPFSLQPFPLSPSAMVSSPQTLILSLSSAQQYHLVQTKFNIIAYMYQGGFKKKKLPNKSTRVGSNQLSWFMWLATRQLKSMLSVGESKLTLQWTQNI